MRSGAEPLSVGPTEADIISLVAGLVQELRGGDVRQIEVTRSSRLDRDLGIDSLGRTELILRIERSFAVQLPISVMGRVATVGDLLDALAQGGSAAALSTVAAAGPVLPKVRAAMEARTLPEMLDWHAAQHADRLHATVLQDDHTVIATLSYGELSRAARAVAGGLLAHNIGPGDRVALMLPTGTDFFAAFFGVLYAGAIPVPIYPPMQLTQLEEYARRQAGILRNAGVRLLVTMPEGIRLAALLRSLVGTVEAVQSVAGLSASSAKLPLPRFQEASATALIQYTSGSTGDPKGVVLSHANLLANIRAIGRAIDASSADVMVSWLPLYHDMGLIGSWLGSLYFGAPLYIMSPLAFLARPQSWLWAIHRFRGTISAAPNFAFELCLDKIDAGALAGLDLSSLRILANGAEPVSIPTLRRFTERFRPCGLRPEAMAPVYGLAENAVAVALPASGQAPLIDRISRTAFSQSGVAKLSTGAADIMEVVSCGAPIPDHQVRIVGADGRELGERREGELEFRGPSATSGYFGNPTKTRDLFHDDWLVSGDRAYVADGRVFITGRIKDIVIRGGQHIYPHEVENAVADIAGVRRGGAVMFGLSDPASGTERIVVLAETDLVDPDTREKLRTLARQATVDAVGVAPDDIVLVRPGTIPKTQSGKVRRAAARDLYLSRRLDARAAALNWQLVRLFLLGLPARIGRFVRNIAELTYAIWWWAVLTVSAVVGIAAILVMPKLSWRWSVVRSLAKFTLTVVGATPQVEGGNRLPLHGAILMFNHASYVDALVLGAVLPGEPVYLAKKEFASQFLQGAFLRRLGVLFVDRYDLAAGLADIAVAIAAASRDRVLVIFPEGTFTQRPGLSGFYLGGFKIAAEAGLNIVPGILRGTRTMLRSDQWLPRRTAIHVEIADPVQPAGKEFAAVLRLRDLVRQAILVRCDEPDVNELIKPAPSAGRSE